MRRIITTAVCVTVLATPAASAATNDELRYLMPVTKRVETPKPKPREKCPGTMLKLEQFKQKTWEAQTALGNRLTASSSQQIRSCSYARWAMGKWKQRAEAAALERSRRVLPNTGDWQTAVAVVQRVHPGTSGWLLSCSSSEGGHGPFVFNRQGSGAAGWLQFMPSTFVWMFNAALKDAVSKGYVVPKQASSIYSPLGQALAGGWAVRAGHSGHWYGGGC